MTGHPTFVVVAFAAWALAAWIWLTFNRLIAYRNECRNALAQVDVQLARRHELLPKLEAVLKGSMNFEASTLETVTRLRQDSVAAPNLAGRLRVEAQLGVAIGALMLQVEAYPELRSMDQALELQRQVVSTEDRIAFSRTYYNDISANYNTLIEGFPARLLAPRLGFELQPWFRERSA